MKILFDKNVFISYLLAQGARNDVMEAVEACLTAPGIEIVVPQEVIDEIKRIVSEKPYLRLRINEESLADFLKAIETLGEICPPLTDIASISRDRDDDFLLAHAKREGVKFLVTGDDDLLSLGGFSSVEIVNVSRLSEILLDRKHELGQQGGRRLRLQIEDENDNRIDSVHQESSSLDSLTSRNAYTSQS